MTARCSTYISPTRFEPGSGICFIEQLGIREGLAVCVVRTLGNIQSVVSSNAPRCKLLVVRVDVILAAIFISKPAFSVLGDRAGMPSLHLAVIALEVVIVWVSCWGPENGRISR